MAAASSVMSIAAGHHVMHLPQPTHPDVPNWSNQVDSLCVIHCRYRDAVEVWTLPPWMYECCALKHESQRRSRCAAPAPGSPRNRGGGVRISWGGKA